VARASCPWLGKTSRHGQDACHFGYLQTWARRLCHSARQPKERRPGLPKWLGADGLPTYFFPIQRFIPSLLLLKVVPSTCVYGTGRRYSGIGSLGHGSVSSTCCGQARRSLRLSAPCWQAIRSPRALHLLILLNRGPRADRSISPTSRNAPVFHSGHNDGAYRHLERDGLVNREHSAGDRRMLLVPADRHREELFSTRFCPITCAASPP